MRLTRRRKFAVLAIGLIAVVVYFSLGPTSADMRLDTGDLRYRYMGIPIVYERMPEPQRSRLLQLTQGSRVCAPTWEQCASFPLHTSNNPDAMCRGFYMRIDAWIDVDKKLALAGVEDIARYISETNGRRGLPRSTPLLFKTKWSDDDRARTMRVEEGWQADAGIAEYRKSLGN
ncbi:MAG: hypothetical protein JWN40_1406 [Phycisphaerales bacterium]|nr:hypothetical protein [Phycisphaerales bacterium]